MAAFRSRAARALAILHEQSLDRWVAASRRARSAALELPETADPNCRTLDAMTAHVINAARGYLQWLAETLGLPSPGHPERLPVESAVSASESHFRAIRSHYQDVLALVSDEQMELPITTAWGDPCTVDFLLEHAVCHPLRHALQLEELLDGPVSLDADHDQSVSGG